MAIHLGSERICLKGEYAGALSLAVSADVCTVQGAIELLESWFNVDKQASFQILITEDDAPPATIVTSSSSFALHFIALTLERCVCRQAQDALERERRALRSETPATPQLATVAE